MILTLKILLKTLTTGSNENFFFRKFISFFAFLSISFALAAQNESIISIPDSLSLQSLRSLEDIRMIQMKEVSANRYKMYPTQNMYNLLKLDTQSGRIEQVQWSLDDNNEFTSVINSEDLPWKKGLNSFELYPTQNMYQFILLDKATGRTWHVQWGLDYKKRWIKRIY
ncbi:MAG: hypothetical protein K2M88_08645 [Muribaculaceae bacterium]|nr:hypothetical protein [Muribaculaceae bacterium]